MALELEIPEIENLLQDEMIARSINDIKKCSEISIKILNYYIEKKDLHLLMSRLDSLINKKNQFALVKLTLLIYFNKKCTNNIYSSEYKSQYLSLIRNTIESIQIKNTSTKNTILENLNSLNIYSMDKLFQDLLSEINPTDIEFSEIKNNSKSSESSSETNTSSFKNKDNDTKLANSSIIDSTPRQSTLGVSDASPESLNYKYDPEDKYSKKRSIDGDLHLTDFKTKKTTSVIKEFLPYVKVSVDITISNSEIVGIFSRDMKNEELRIEEKNEGLILLTKISKNICSCILNTLKLSDSPYITMNSLKLLITKNVSNNKNEKILEISGNAGENAICERIIYKFISYLKKKSRQLKILSNKSSIIFDDTIIKNSQVYERTGKREGSLTSCNDQIVYSALSDEHDLESENPDSVSKSNKEASSYYDFYKILSQENYDLGKSVSEFIENFKKNNTDLEISTKNIPKQMEQLLNFVEECVNTFHSYYNYGKTERMLVYCRPAVEKFIFNKIYGVLYDMYNNKFAEDNNKFMAKIEQIKLLGPEKIMEFLEVRSKFKGISMDRKYIPYKSTIDCINKIELEINPKDKFDSLMKASLEMRNFVLEITNGKGILNALDDELPLFIYCTTQVAIKNIFAELRMIEDYLQYSTSIDKESKVLITLQGACHYILHDWTI